MIEQTIALTVLLAATLAGAASPTTQPAATAPVVDPAAWKLLQAVEAAGDKVATIRADLNYLVVNPTLGDREVRTGHVVYQKAAGKTPAKFRIHFETLRQGRGRTIRARVDYAFDGRWLRVARHKTRQLKHYQVVAEGRRVEPLRLGKGPFPIPFGQKAADVVRFFTPSTRPPKPTDPKNTHYLKLVTRRSQRSQTRLRDVEMWIDQKTRLPVKIVSRDKSRTVTTVAFAKTKTNVKLEKGTFDLPRKMGWDESFERLKKGTRIQP